MSDRKRKKFEREILWGRDSGVTTRDVLTATSPAYQRITKAVQTCGALDCWCVLPVCVLQLR